MTRHIARSGAAALIVLFLAVGTAMAGGWATITPDEGSGSVQPKEDEPVVIGFTVLQHGETPAPWEHPTVIATNATTGERLEVQATSDRSDGHFSATLTFPEAGLWSWRVDLGDLLVDAPATVPISVLTPEGIAPTVDMTTTFRIADLAADGVRTELREEQGTRLNELQTQVESQAGTIARLSAQLERAGTASAASSSRASDGIPAIGVILLSVLAGAGSAFLMLLLGRPSVTPRTPSTPASPGYAPTTR